MINKFIKKIKGHKHYGLFSTGVALLLLIVLIFLSYDQTSKLFYKKIKWGDDLEVLTEAKILAKNKLEIFNINRYSAAAGISTHYTPFLYLLWMPFSEFFNDNAKPYLVFGFIIHAINAILFFFIILRISKNKLASLSGAALFLIFPGNLITIGWISASLIYGPTILFAFLCFLLFIKYLNAKNKFYLFLSLIFYLLGCLSKQVFYSFFIILISYEILIHSGLTALKYSKKNIKELIIRHSPFVLLSIIFILIQLYRYKQGWIYQLKGGALFHPIIFYRLLDFLKEFFWPLDISNYYLRFSLIFLIFVLFYFLFFYSRNNLFKFSVIWIIFLGLMPMSQHLRSVSESIRYIYTISPGFFMLISFLYVWKKWLGFIPFALIVVYFLALYNKFIFNVV